MIPLLQPSDDHWGTERPLGIARAYTSAQHPIAYGAMLAMFVPPALFFVCRRRSPVWWLALLLIILGLISSVSRTSVVMLVVGGGIVLWLRPDSRRFLPLLLPLAIAAQIAVPGTFGNYRELFFPSEGIVAEQARGDHRKQPGDIVRSCDGPGRAAPLPRARLRYADSRR